MRHRSALRAALSNRDSVTLQPILRWCIKNISDYRITRLTTDVALVVLGGGIGANGDLLLTPVRALLAKWLPYPPRVEVSSLGDAAVLTGAVAVGLRAALDNVFVSRSRRRRA